MKFETLLARRYIKAQKRHSVLTVCSIVISVALMTLMFTCFTTLRGIIRDMHYDSAPYHVVFFNVTKAQGAAIRHMNQVESCELIPNANGVTYRAQVMFGDYIDDQFAYCAAMIRELKLNARCDPETGLAGMEFNNLLMNDDGVTLQSKYRQTQIVALLFVYIIVLALILRLIIDTAFEVSSKERERQFGVLQSVGATTKQIVRIMTVEGMILSVIGVPLGVGLGLLLSAAAYKAVLASGVAEAYFDADKISRVIHMHIDPLMTLTAGAVGFAWVFFSAYGTGMRVIKKSPIQAITARSNTVKKVKRFTLLSLIFGWKGKVASRNARRSRKRFIITVLSLTLSLTLFASVSSVFKGVEETVEKAIVMYDEFGPIDYDFDLTLSPFSWEDGLHDPLDYREGAELLENSGFFEDLDYGIYRMTKTPDGEKAVYVQYCSRAEYKRIFGEKPEISYDALTESGSAILLNDTDYIIPEGTETVTLNARYVSESTKEEYEQYIAEKEERKSRKNTDERIQQENAMFGDKTAVFEGKITSDDGKDLVPGFWYKTEWKPAEYRIVQRSNIKPQYNFMDSGKYHLPAYLILTEDTYRAGDWKKYGFVTLGAESVNVKLKNESDYAAAKNFLFEHGDTFDFHEDDPELEARDMFGTFQRIRKTLSAVHIGLIFVLAMITLIAVVNMVNIVSTGILNRKREFASMQCVGMTHRQMYALTVIECLQFTLWSAVAATVLCCLLLKGTDMFLALMTLDELVEEYMIRYSVPVIKVWIGSIAAFLCALAASLLPLRRMQKEPLVEQIRAVE